MKFSLFNLKNIFVLLLLLLQICGYAQSPGRAKLPAPAKTLQAQQIQTSLSSIPAVATIADLRNLTAKPTDVVYVKYHSNSSDGGGGHFMWRTDAIFKDSKSYFSKDNDGTLIKAKSATGGMWVRQYDGYVNLRYFGANSKNTNEKLQAAIDFASHNNDNNAPTKSTTVYIPNGGWLVDKIDLKNGVNITGDSKELTILYAKTAEEGGTEVPYLFEVPSGPVNVSISNLKILGGVKFRETVPFKGCFHFKASASKNNDGGTWSSSFKNVDIIGFRGNGIYLEGGVTGNLPNQFLLFEMINVGMSTESPKSSSALKITGQQGQLTFFNSAFNGFNNNNTFHKGHVVDISYGPGIENLGSYSAVVSFINSTFQEGDHGVYINYAENVTIDNCWFENLGNAVTVDGSDHACNSINILNNRFANAAGYGALPVVAPNILQGACVTVINSLVTIANNYVTASDLNSSKITDDYFIMATGLPGSINPGVEAYGNNYASPVMDISTGIVPRVTSITDNILECGHNKMVVANNVSGVVSIINSIVNAGETLYIKSAGRTITFKETNRGNLLLGKTGSLTLNDGEVAGFTKMDDPDGNPAVYQLTSVIKNL